MNPPFQKRRVIVMAGGPSAEREVSLKSGAAVAAALQRLGHEVEPLDPKPGQWRLPSETEAVFLALHGVYGEDGGIQKELEDLGVPFTGSNSAASRTAFDKALSKEKFLEAGLHTPASRVFRSLSEPFPDGWKCPVILKPPRQGSSVGLQFVDSLEQWEEALKQAFSFENEVLLEERIQGREVTVGILNGQTLPLVEVRPKQGGYDYHNKYTPGATDYQCPAPLDAAQSETVARAGLKAFEAVGARDYARVDTILSGAGVPHVLEVNTLPGMTATSLLPMAAAQAGIDFDALCGRMLDMAFWK